MKSNALINVTLFLVTTGFLGTSAVAQEEGNCPPNTRLTIYSVKQTLVCPPSGYADRDGNEYGKACREEINRDMIDEWEEQGKISSNVKVVRNLPPNEIKLNKSQLDVANGFRQLCSDRDCEPSSRKAILLKFHFDIPNPSGVEVKLKRMGNVPYESPTGVLQAGGMWINHQNAIHFIPASGSRWELTVGKRSCRLNSSAE